MGFAPGFELEMLISFKSSGGCEKKPGFTVGRLTQPMAKRLKLFGITCLVGKISRLNGFILRVQDG